MSSCLYQGREGLLGIGHSSDAGTCQDPGGLM